MTRRRVVIAPVASWDVSDLLLYLGDERGMAAATAAERAIDRAMASLETLAERGRIVPELAARGVAGYREIRALSYRVVHRVAGHEVWVVAVVDHRRDLDGLLAARARRG